MNDVADLEFEIDCLLLDIRNTPLFWSSYRWDNRPSKIAGKAEWAAKVYDIAMVDRPAIVPPGYLSDLLISYSDIFDVRHHIAHGSVVALPDPAKGDSDPFVLSRIKSTKNGNPHTHLFSVALPVGLFKERIGAVKAFAFSIRAFREYIDCPCSRDQRRLRRDQISAACT